MPVLRRPGSQPLAVVLVGQWNGNRCLRIFYRIHVGKRSRKPVVSVDRAVRIHGRVAPVGADECVEKCRALVPIPDRDHHIPVDSLRARRHRRQLALSDAIHPIGKERGPLVMPQTTQQAGHVRAQLTGRNEPLPGLRAVLKLAQACGNLASWLVSQLVAPPAVLHGINPLGLRRYHGGMVCAETVMGKALFGGTFNSETQ